MATLMEELVVRIGGEADSSLSAAIGTSKSGIKDLQGNVELAAMQIQQYFSRVAGGATAMINSWLAASKTFEDMKIKLETVLKSAEKANTTLRAAVEFAAKTPFDVEGIVSATVQLEVYGQKSGEILPYVADLAAGMSKNIKETSLVIGKAMSGSLEGFESLRNEYGISSASLAKYGAELNTQGGIMVQSTSQLEKARTALKKVIEMQFGGAIEKQMNTLSTAASNFGDVVTKIAWSLGDQLAPAFTLAYKVGTALANLFEALPAPIQAVVAWGTVLVAGLATVGAGFAGILAILPGLVSGYKIVNDWYGKLTASGAQVVAAVTAQTTAHEAETAALIAKKTAIEATAKVQQSNIAQKYGAGNVFFENAGSMESGKSVGTLAAEAQGIKTTVDPKAATVGYTAIQQEAQKAGEEATKAAAKTTAAMGKVSDSAKNMAASTGFSFHKFVTGASSFSGAFWLAATAVGVAAGYIAFNIGQKFGEMAASIEYSKNSLVRNLSGLTYVFAFMTGGVIGVLGNIAGQVDAFSKIREEEIKRDEATLGTLRDNRRRYSKDISEIAKGGLEAEEQARKDYDGIVKADLELQEQIKDAKEKGQTEYAQNLEEIRQGILKYKDTVKEAQYAAHEFARATLAMNQGLKDLKNNLEVFTQAGWFTIPSQEIEYITGQLKGLKKQLEIKFNLKGELSGDQGDIKTIITKIQDTKNAMNAAEQNLKTAMGEGDKSRKQDELKQYKEDLDTLQSYLEMVIRLRKLTDAEMKAIDEAAKTAEKERLTATIDAKKDYISYAKQINQMGKEEEIKIEEERLTRIKELEKQGILTKKDVLEQTRAVEVLKYEAVKDSKDKTIRAYNEELKAIDKLKTGKVAAYDAVIAKVKEAYAAGKVDAGAANEFFKEAKNSRNEAVDQDVKDSYERLKDAQKLALDRMKADETKSVYDRLSLMDTYIRAWKAEEERRPQFKKEIESEITSLLREQEAIRLEVIRKNKDAEKDILNLQKDSIDYEIGKLEEKLEKGEAVEGKLIDKFKERMAIEMQLLQEQIQEWENQGIQREKIEAKIAGIKLKYHRAELSQIDQLIQRLKDKDKAAASEQKARPMQKYGSPAEAFGASDLTVAIASGKAQKDNERAIADLEARKAQLQAEIRRLDGELAKWQGKLAESKPDSATAKQAQNEIERIRQEKRAAQEAAGINPDSQNFAVGITAFNDAVNLFAGAVEKLTGVPVQSGGGGGGASTTGSAGAGAGMPGGGSVINIYINGQGTGTGGVKVEDTPNGKQITIPKDLGQKATPQTKPTGKSNPGLSFGPGGMNLTTAMGMGGMLTSSPIANPSAAWNIG